MFLSLLTYCVSWLTANIIISPVSFIFCNSYAHYVTLHFTSVYLQKILLFKEKFYYIPVKFLSNIVCVRVCVYNK